MERRGFSFEKPVAQAANEIAARIFDVPQATINEVACGRWTRRAMATSFEILIPIGFDRSHLHAHFALDLIDDLEEQLSVYIDDSELSRLNASAFGCDVRVESNLFQLLKSAASITRSTNGAFDIATGALTKAWGFYRREGRVPDVAERTTAMAKTGTRFLALDDDSKSVRFLREGLEINLGAIGKGYALDRAARLLIEGGIDCALLHGGSSSVLAVGHPTQSQTGWKVAIRHPWRSDCNLGILNLKRVALGVSAATFQYFEYNGRKLGHVIDPRNGWPASGVQQACVVAPTAAEADALSTAFFVAGLEAATEFCRTRPEIGAIVLPDNTEKPVVLNLDSETFIPTR
jgi:FAD:protein FMN transferase